MRNKHNNNDQNNHYENNSFKEDGETSNNNTDFINIVDEQLYSYNPPSPNSSSNFNPPMPP